MNATATVPFRPRCADRRLDHGRLVKVYEGPPSVPIRPDITTKGTLPKIARVWVGNDTYSLPPGMSLITLVWRPGDQKTCKLCPRCRAHRTRGYFHVDCERMVPREPADELNEHGMGDMDIPTALERIRQANL